MPTRYKTAFGSIARGTRRHSFQARRANTVAWRWGMVAPGSAYLSPPPVGSHLPVPCWGPGIAWPFFSPPEASFLPESCLYSSTKLVSSIFWEGSSPSLYSLSPSLSL